MPARPSREGRAGLPHSGERHGNHHHQGFIREHRPGPQGDASDLGRFARAFPRGGAADDATAADRRFPHRGQDKPSPFQINNINRLVRSPSRPARQPGGFFCTCEPGVRMNPTGAARCWSVPVTFASQTARTPVFTGFLAWHAFCSYPGERESNALPTKSPIQGEPT